MRKSQPIPDPIRLDRAMATRTTAATTAAEPTYFSTPAAFRAWLGRHGGRETQLAVGFHKVASGTPSLTWPEAVDEALCVGWIDGVRRRVDATRYQIRFTPRKAGSTWSAVNIARMAVLEGAGRVRRAGAAAFAARSEAKSRTYSYEQATASTFAPDDEAAFRANRAAWAFFEAQPAGYRRLSIWRVVSAKLPATRARRLAALIVASADHLRT